MALKMKKTTTKKRLPKGGDRFVWDKLPESAKKIDYAKVLKFAPKKPA